MQRIQCQKCDECFALTDTKGLRDHLKFHHTESLRVKFIEKEVKVCDVLGDESYSDYLSGTMEDAFEEDIEVIRGTPAAPPPRTVEHDLWETESAWNSMRKSLGLS